MTATDKYYGPERVDGLRRKLSLLQSQQSTAEEDAKELSEVCQELLSILRSGTPRAIPAALEYKAVCEERDRAFGKAEKIRREAEELKARLQSATVLGRGGVR